MSTPLEDLRARLDELKADLELVTTSIQLRPRLGEVLEWCGPGEIVQLAQRFMNSKEARPEGIYGPLLVRLMAGFERYLRLLIVEGVESVLFMTQVKGDEGIGVLFVGVTLAGITAAFCNSLGTLVCAQGQMVWACLDSAVNSSPFLTNELRAKAMSI